MNINNHDITSIIRDVSTESVSKAGQPMPNRNLEFEIFGHKFKPLCTSNLHRIIVAQINISFIRNKFDALLNGVIDNIDSLMISYTKTDNQVEEF